ncbi:MAG: carbohydrate kinase [Verrucomicrobia bacterium]|nr:MAG: carbohydrate kinase [Verrucomicrobiota bacterium]
MLAPLDVFCVGLLCADLVLTVDGHPGPNEKIRARSRLIAPGGPAVVAAAQVARLGGRVAFAGLVGRSETDPLAALLRREVEAEGIDCAALVEREGFTTPLACVLVKPDGARAVVSHRDTADTGRVERAGAPSGFPPARIILADGHRPEWTPAVVGHARATEALLVLDAGSWTAAVQTLAAEADHVVASEACARAALGSRDPADPTLDLHSALGARKVATVVVTLGARGVVWCAAGSRGAREAFPVDEVDTTGAGDGFHGAYAFGLARGLSLPACLRLASAAGALACTRLGAWSAVARRAEIEAFLAKFPRNQSEM